MAAAAARGFGVRRASTVSLAATLLAACLAGLPVVAEERPEGITTPVTLAPFDPTAPVCSVPPGLSRSIGFAQDNNRDFMDGVSHGLEQAARDRGLSYVARVSDNDASRQAEDVELFRTQKLGAVISAPVDAPSLAPHLQELMWSGAYVGGVVPPPATTILNAPQYLTGRTLGDAAAAHIRNVLGGKAKVVLLTHDSLQFLTPRFVAMRDALKDMPEVEIVADISPATVNEAGGYATMQLILEAHADVDVVLGADTVVLGALRALREAGRARPEQFLGGIDGEPAAVAEIEAGNGPYKASIALSSPVFGYALGVLAADWLEGKSVPQAMDILPFALTRENIDEYEADQANPAAVYADAAKRSAYLRMYGNICYDSRDQYLNFPWSSESR
ncbi:MAG: sugar ABC transporter substrate-binding protein [Hyphomicrobiales bacterium]|nr:MAG: sugar ABC transporter substrate-binding protein [Hyphomicrobiales bacterium]